MIGEHKLTLKLADHKEVNINVVIVADETQEFFVTLNPLSFGQQQPPTTPKVPLITQTLPAQIIIPGDPENKDLVINIETEGFRPWEHRIIAIGVQDPSLPDEPPKIIMGADEALMIQEFLALFKRGQYDRIIGYNITFDYRFIIMRSMRYGMPLKEFQNAKLYDLQELMSKGRIGFVFNQQRAPKLSDLSDFLFSFPKAFSDADMLEFWATGQFDLVRQFASDQVTRTLLLYFVTRYVIEKPVGSASIPIVRVETLPLSVPPSAEPSPLTIPEAQAPTTWTATCPNDSSEHIVPITQNTFTCPIDGTIITRK